VLKFLVAMLLVTAVSIFAVNNMQRVEVSLIVGKPVHVRLFFLLLTSFLAGSLLALLVSLYARTRPVRTRKTAVVEKKKTEDDEFFPE